LTYNNYIIIFQIKKWLQLNLKPLIFVIVIVLDIKINIIKFEALNWRLYKLIKIYNNIKNKNWLNKNYKLNILPINIKILILNTSK